MILRQTFEKPQNGVMDTGPYNSFDWQIDRQFDDGKSRVGSWGANYFFEVSTGKTERATLANARRALTASAKRLQNGCRFEYVEE